MIYNSFNFLIIYPLIFLLYYVIPAKYKKMRDLYLFIVCLLYTSVGFLQLKEDFDSMKIDPSFMRCEGEIDTLKIEYIDKFIDLAEGSQLFFVSSPIWYALRTFSTH